MLNEGSSCEPDILYDAAWNRIAGGLDGLKPSPKEGIGFLSARKTAVLLASACAVLIIALILARPGQTQPAMSITEMEEVLRSFGDFDQAEGRAFQYGSHEPYRLMGNSESGRLHRIAGVGTTDDKTYSIEPF